MASSTATVTTDRPHRYGKQLASHLGRRCETSWDDQTGHGKVIFPEDVGSATMVAEPGALVLSIDTEDDALDRLEDVMGRHLVRFGSRDELAVEWRRDNGTPGTVQTNTLEPSDAEHER